jgi:hypothetical protein
MVGGFMNLGPVGGAGIGWASAVYRFDLPIVVRAEISPFVVGAEHAYTSTLSPLNTGEPQVVGGAPGGATVVSAGHVMAGVDTQYVEVAVGGGASSVSASYYGGGQANVGPSIVEEGRFGARDGLAIGVEFVTVAANDQFSLASFLMTAQVPITPSFQLIARGGGGAVGVLFGDLGARVVVQGDGGPDTLALVGFFGGAGMDFESCAPAAGAAQTSYCSSTSIGGPSVGGGIEWRR